VDAPFVSDQELIRPWRRATIVASLVAGVELVLLIVIGMLLLAKPLSHALQQQAEAKVLAPAKEQGKQAKQILPTTIAVGLPKLSRQETGVFVLNGNGRSGAAAAAAGKLKGFGYVVPGTGNAPRDDYATTFIMFRPGFKAEALRLGRDLKIKAVSPIDGITPGELRGAHLAVILGRG
jgi:hypothetical protein